MKKKTKDPAFLFYTSDFYLGTEEMTFEHLGMYLKLLMKQHLKGWISEQNFFAFFGCTKDAPNLHQICTKFAPVISKFTKKNTGKAIYYYNVRLDFEIKRRAEYAESRRVNALGNRAENSDQNKQKFFKKDEIKNKHMPNHMENENENRKRGLQRGKNKLAFSLQETKNITARLGDFTNEYIYGFHLQNEGNFENEGDLISKFKKSIKRFPPKEPEIFKGPNGTGQRLKNKIEETLNKNK